MTPEEQSPGVLIFLNNCGTRDILAVEVRPIHTRSAMKTLFSVLALTVALSIATPTEASLNPQEPLNVRQAIVVGSTKNKSVEECLAQFMFGPILRWMVSGFFFEEGELDIDKIVADSDSCLEYAIEPN